MNLSKSEFKHILQMLNDAADVLESYSDHEEQAHEIRNSINKIIENNKEDSTEDEIEGDYRPRLSDYLDEPTYSDELYDETKGEK